MVPVGDDDRAGGSDGTGTGPTDEVPARGARVPPSVEVFADPKPWWRRRVVVGGAVAAAAAVVAVLALVVFQIGRPEHEVPSLEALQITQIGELVDTGDWDIRQVGERADDTRAGQILAQDPEPGTMLREGEPLTLTVSRGPTLVPVPDDLFGQTVEDATASITDAGLTVGEIVRKYNELAPVDTVLATGNFYARLPKGDSVALSGSRGPRPRVVPEGLEGGTFDNAAAALADVQLVAVRGEDASESVPEGAVIRTEPGAGSEVDRDSEVVVVVSTGPPLIEIPDVLGDIASEVADLLESLGFEIAGVVGSPNREVVDTDPRPGSFVQTGTDVTIYTVFLGGDG